MGLHPVSSAGALVHMSATLLSGAILSTTAAAVYLYVAFRLSRRVSEDRPFAGWAFVVWWVGVALFLLVWDGAAVFLVVAEAAPLPIMVAMRVFSLLVLCAGVAGLMVYLSYLFTGRRFWALPLGLSYAVLFVAFVVLTITSGPVGMEVQRWRVDLEYETTIRRPYIVLLSLLILPTSVGAAAYFTLRYRTKDPYMRFRIALVAVSIFVYGVSSLLGRISDHDLWQLFTRSGVGLIAALVILFAYDTPAVVRRRFGAPDVEEAVKGFQEEQQTRRQAVRRRRQRDLEDRIEDLI